MGENSPKTPAHVCLSTLRAAPGTEFFAPLISLDTHTYWGPISQPPEEKERSLEQSGNMPK